MVYFIYLSLNQCIWIFSIRGIKQNLKLYCNYFLETPVTKKMKKMNTKPGKRVKVFLVIHFIFYIYTTKEKQNLWIWLDDLNLTLKLLKLCSNLAMRKLHFRECSSLWLLRRMWAAFPKERQNSRGLHNTWLDQLNYSKNNNTWKGK